MEAAHACESRGLSEWLEEPLGKPCRQMGSVLIPGDRPLGGENDAVTQGESEP